MSDAYFGCYMSTKLPEMLVEERIGDDPLYVPLTVGKETAIVINLGFDQHGGYWLDEVDELIFALDKASVDGLKQDFWANHSEEWLRVLSLFPDLVFKVGLLVG